MKILVVDDEPIFCDLISVELAACGFKEVCAVNSGAAAISLVRENSSPFDCILLDIDMPGMDGIELCRLLRAEPSTTGLPIVMVTARSEVESVDKAFAAGATDYLTKPVDRRELQGRMTMASGMARERAARKAVLMQNTTTNALSFEEPFRLQIDHSCMDYLALQNYVLKLGTMRLFSHIAIAFQVVNAWQLYQTLDNSEFQGTMSDVAEVIAEVLVINDAIVSYVGSGFFVALAKRIPEVSVEEISSQIEMKLQTMNDWYSNLDQMPVLMKIGTPNARGIVNFLSATEILDTALQNTRESTAVLGGYSAENSIVH
ncbi:response regulator [Ruegeria sp. SCP11]|uniref:response regulator n=1 Tax=Ruegeria sp. SCP11 TaxID=3141378 RepID=UPI00333C2EAD